MTEQNINVFSHFANNSDVLVMSDLQNKYLGEFLFRQMPEGVYGCITGNFIGTPVDFCEIFGIYCVPDYCHFMRIKNRELGFVLEWRDYGGQIRINVNAI